MNKEKLHYRISMVKSVVRIVGYAWLPISIGVAAGLLVVSELLGIAEEIWGA